MHAATGRPVKRRKQADDRRNDWHPQPPVPVDAGTDVRTVLRRRSRWSWHALLLMVAFVQGAVVEASAWATAEVQSGSLLLHMPEGYRMAPLLNTDVSITINGLVGRVSVMQQFENTSQGFLEGIYVFPLPDRAAVDRMRVYIGDRLIEGEIREREAARKIYEAARQAGEKTSLVEQQRANVFTTSIANIAPGETVIVEIEYLESIHYDNGTFSMRVPLTLTPRYEPAGALPDRKDSGRAADSPPDTNASRITPPMVTTSRAHKVSLRASLDAGMPLEIIASRNHPVHIAESGGRYTVALAGDRAPMDHDFEFLWRPVETAVPRAMTFRETIAGDVYYLLMVMPPDGTTHQPMSIPRDLIFIVDTSGSMHGASLEQAKQALLRALDGLEPADRFNVIEFNTDARPLFAASMPADSLQVATARNFVRQLESTGGTEMYPALELALATPAEATRLRQIVFITDGAVGNEEELFRLIEARLGDARLFTVGIGSAPNSWFMRKASEAGRGTFTIISALHEVGEKMDALFRKLEQPQLTGIELHWPGNVIVDSYPNVVPDLYSGEPVTVLARVEQGFRPGDTMRVAGASAAGAWHEELTLESDTQSAGIGALWARARIADLLDARRRGADPEQVRSAVVTTALTHRLVSPYTSLVAVDRTPARSANDPLSSEQVPSLMPYGQTMAAIVGFPATATDAAARRNAGLELLAAALVLTISTALIRGIRHGFPA